MVCACAAANVPPMRTMASGGTWRTSLSRSAWLTGVKVMPQIGHLPGPSDRTEGSIEQV